VIGLLIAARFIVTLLTTEVSRTDVRILAEAVIDIDFNKGVNRLILMREEDRTIGTESVVIGREHICRRRTSVRLARGNELRSLLRPSITTSLSIALSLRLNETSNYVQNAHTMQDESIATLNGNTNSGHHASNNLLIRVAVAVIVFGNPGNSFDEFDRLVVGRTVDLNDHGVERRMFGSSHDVVLGVFLKSHLISDCKALLSFADVGRTGRLNNGNITEQEIAIRSADKVVSAFLSSDEVLRFFKGAGAEATTPSVRDFFEKVMAEVGVAATAFDTRKTVILVHEGVVVATDAASERTVMGSKTKTETRGNAKVSRRQAKRAFRRNSREPGGREFARGGKQASFVNFLCDGKNLFKAKAISNVRELMLQLGMSVGKTGARGGVPVESLRVRKISLRKELSRFLVTADNLTRSGESIGPILGRAESGCGAWLGRTCWHRKPEAEARAQVYASGDVSTTLVRPKPALTSLRLSC
jgi:hypothetical protein